MDMRPDHQPRQAPQMYVRARGEGGQGQQQKRERKRAGRAVKGLGGGQGRPTPQGRLGGLPWTRGPIIPHAAAKQSVMKREAKKRNHKTLESCEEEHASGSTYPTHVRTYGHSPMLLELATVCNVISCVRLPLSFSVFHPLSLSLFPSLSLCGPPSVPLLLLRPSPRYHPYHKQEDVHHQRVGYVLNWEGEERHPSATGVFVPGGGEHLGSFQGWRDSSQPASLARCSTPPPPKKKPNIF